ncbi:MAG: efflux RND transporter periplasmic adaptor subunit [Planctomycetes bacterium]|nr:efflux RND transporter periplasmic adaptor subunit [Planctomycetota bacterium]
MPTIHSLFRLVAVALLVSSVAGISLGAEPAALPANTVRVATIKPARKALRRVIEQPATIEPYEITPLYFRVPGYVKGVRVDIGDAIHGPQPTPPESQGKPAGKAKAGEPLAELSVPELEAELRQKESLVTQAKSEVVQAKAAVRVAQEGITVAKADMAAAEAAVAGAEAMATRYESELKRFVALKERDAVPSKLVDETTASRDAAASNVRAAQAKITAVKAAIQQSQALLEKAAADVAAAEARQRVAEANVEQTRTMWGYRVLVAPYDGVVTRRNIHTGHLVQGSTGSEPALIVARTDRVRVLIDVPEADADQVAANSPVTLRFPALGGLQVEAKVIRTSWALDRATRTLRAEVDLPNPRGQFHAGMYVYASITSAQRAGALVLPTAAIFADKSQSYCATIEDGVIRRRPVTLGVRAGTEVEITGGLKDDAVVVAANGANLADGQPAQPIPAP